MRRQSARNAPRVRVLRGKELARGAIDRLERVMRIRHGSDNSRGDGADVKFSPYERATDVHLVIAGRVNEPDDVRFGRKEWGYDRYHRINVVGMTPDAAASTIASALERFILTYKTHAEIDREEEAAERFDDVRARSATAIEGTMPEHVRDAINDELAQYVGGKPLFRSVGAAIAKCAEILSRHGYEWGEVINAHTFMRDSGHTAIDLAQSKQDDPFSPAQVDDASLSFQWHKFETGRVEAVAYVSRGVSEPRRSQRNGRR